MKEQGGARLQQEVLGFYICRDRNLGCDIARTGIRANPYVNGCLGDPRHGVYLFRYLDVALMSQRECRNAYVLVFKVLQGRVKQVPVQEMGSRCTPKEPTPNFDCHLSQAAPRHDETVNMMCSKSQMYVYEYTEDAEPAQYPRQCLPYAFLEFSNYGYALTDIGAAAAAAVEPKGISTSAANAGWASMRRPGGEAGRKGGGDRPGQQPGLPFPAGQGGPQPAPPAASESALHSPRDTEPLPSVTLGPEGGTWRSLTETGTWRSPSEGGMWRSPWECGDNNQPVPAEASSSPSRPLGGAVQPRLTSDGVLVPGGSRFERDALAASSDHSGQFSMAASAPVSRDPRFQRLLGNDRPSNPSGSNMLSLGEQQAGVLAQNAGSLGEGESREVEGGLIVNKLPHVPSLDRTPGKSALKKSTAAWHLSSQADGLKKKKTLSFQDYLKKKKAEAQGNADGKGTDQTPNPFTEPDRTETAKVSSAGLSEESVSPRKQFSSFRKDEFQGCVYYPPEMLERKASVSKLAGVKSTSPVRDSEAQVLKADRTNSDSCESIVSNPSPVVQSESPKPARRDPRIRASYTSSVYSGKVATKEPNESEDSNSSLVLSGRPTTTKEPSDDDSKLNGSDRASSSASAAEDKRESAAESPLKLSSDSQAKSDDAQNKTTVSQEEKEEMETDKEPVQEHSESSLVDLANHQVLFADLEETDENALSVCLGETSPPEHSAERGGRFLFSDFAQSHVKAESTPAVNSVTKQDACAMEEDETQDADGVTHDQMEREHDSEDEKPNTVLSLIMLALKHGLRKGLACQTTEPSEDLKENMTVKQEVCDENQSSLPDEPSLQQETSVNTAQSTNRLFRITGLKERLASATAEDGRKNKDVSKACTSTVSSVQTGKRPKSVGGKGQKPETKRKGKAPEASEVADSDVDYALLRLAKGLRPGKSIHVEGLGKNPTDDPLPYLEGKRRKKMATETKPGGPKVAQVRNGKNTPKSQTAGKKTRKKNKSTLGTGKKKKKAAAGTHANPPNNDDDIDYTDFQFEEPQEFSISIRDDMERVSNAPGSSASETRVKVEPPDETVAASMHDQGLGPAVEVEPGTQPPPGGCGGGARPLSWLGLLHWTEALLQPSLNPQVALVDLFTACKGGADFDNCEICQKVIDLKMIEDDDDCEAEEEATPSTAEGTASHDSCKTSDGGSQNSSPLTSEQAIGERLEKGLGKQSAGDVSADKGKVASSVTELQTTHISADKGKVTSSGEELQTVPVSADNGKVTSSVTELQMTHISADTGKVTSSGEELQTVPVSADKGKVTSSGEELQMADVSADKAKVISSVRELQTAPVSADKGKVTSSGGELQTAPVSADKGKVTSSGEELQTAQSGVHLEMTVEESDDQTAVQLSEVVSDSREVNRNYSQEQDLVQTNTSYPPLKQSLVGNESVTEREKEVGKAELLTGTEKEMATHGSCTDRTEERTLTALPSCSVVGGGQMASNGIEGSSGMETSTPSVGPSPVTSPKEKAPSLLEPFPAAPKQPANTPAERAVSQEKGGIKISVSVKSSLKSQVSFGGPASIFPRSRAAVSVCTQGSTRQNWQRWKSSQAQQMQQKTSSDSDTDSSQTPRRVSADDVDEGRGLGGLSVADADGSKPGSQSAVRDSRESKTRTQFMDCAKSTPHIDTREQGKSETSNVTCTKSTEQSVHSESNSSTCVEKRQTASWLESGYWLGISELASLHQSQKDATEAKDTTEIYSRCVSKISPTKLSKLVPGKEESQMKKTPPAFSVAGTESGKVAETTPSTKVTVFSDTHSVDVENKKSKSSIISKPVTERKPCGKSQLTDDSSKAVLFSDSAESSIPSQHSDVISDGFGISVTQEHIKSKRKSSRSVCSLETTETSVKSVKQNIVQSGVTIHFSGSPHITTAEKSDGRKEVHPPPFPQTQTETSVPLKPLSKQSEPVSAVGQMEEEKDSEPSQPDSESGEPEAVTPVSLGKNVELFDSVIKSSCRLTKQPSSCIPGLDLVMSQKTEEDTQPTTNPNPAAMGMAVTTENVDGLHCQDKVSNTTHDKEKSKQQETTSETVLLHPNTESKEGNKECAKDRKNDKACEDLNLTFGPTVGLNKELDAVCTLGVSPQNQRKGKIKMRTFSCVSREVEKRKKTTDAPEGLADSEKSNTDGRQSHDSSGAGKTIDKKPSDGDVESDGTQGQTSENDNTQGQMSGCPIPSFTRARANQKSDRRESKKQSEAKKCGSGKERQFCSGENSSPGFQPAAYDQPRLPGVEAGGDPKVTSPGPFYPNPPLSQFPPPLTYPPPVHVQPMPVNTVFLPSVPVFTAPTSLPSSNLISVCTTSNPVVLPESCRSVPNERVQHVPVVQTMVRPLFATPPPPLAACVPILSLPLTHPVSEVSLGPVSVPQMISVTMNQVCVTAADSSHNSASLQTMAPSVTFAASEPIVTTRDSVDKSREDLGKKSEIDVISWFAEREAAERNPPKKDVMDWFSDIIDTKKNVSSGPNLEPEVKKARLEFMESLKYKKSLCESKEKAPESSSKSSRKSPSESGDAAKTSSSNGSRDSPSESGDAGKTPSKNSRKSVSESIDTGKTSSSKNSSKSLSKSLSESGATGKPVGKDSRKSSCKSADVMKKDSAGSKRQSSSGGSPGVSSNKKPKIDISKVRFRIGLSAEAATKKRGPLMKKIDLDTHSDSDDLTESAEDSHQKASGEKSRSGFSKNKSISSQVYGKIKKDVRKDSKEGVANKTLVESRTHVRKDKPVACETKTDSYKSASSSSSDSRKRLCSRWDEADSESKRLRTKQTVDNSGRSCDVDEDMNDYAHALLEGDVKVEKLGNISNRISDSILKSVSTSKPPKASKNSSIQQNSLPKAEPCSQKESKVSKNKSSLTDKPLEFLLFAKEMIMQKLQEEEGGEEKKSVGDGTDSMQVDPVDSQKPGTLTESGVDASEQKTSEKSTSDARRASGKERAEKNKDDQSKEELASTSQSKTVFHTPSSPLVCAKKEDEASSRKGTVGQSLSAGSERKAPTSDRPQGSSERKAGSTSVSLKSNCAAEGSLSNYDLSASNMSVVTEDEINKLKEIVCQLTSLPTKSAQGHTGTSESTSANKDKPATTMGGHEQRTKPSSSQGKNTPKGQSQLQRNKARREGAAGRDWSLFLTSSRPSFKKQASAPLERRNYYGDVIEPPVYANQDSTTQRQPVHHSTRDSFPGPHARPHFVSEPGTQSDPAATPSLSSMSGVTHPQQNPIQRFSTQVQRESSEHPKTGAAKAENSELTKVHQVQSEDGQKKYGEVWCDSTLQTDLTRAGRHPALAVPSNLTVQMVTGPHAVGQPASETVPPFASTSSTAQGSQVKTLKDFLLENFPCEDPNSFLHLLECQLTDNVNSMSKKMKKNVLFKIRNHLEHLQTVSSTTSATSAIHYPPIPNMLLDEYAVGLIELELRLVEGCLQLSEATEEIQSLPDKIQSGSNVQSLAKTLGRNFRLTVKNALTMVVSDFNNAVTDAKRGLKGRPHQGVPTELLLREEQGKLYTKEGGFTILTAAIPNRPFARLLQYKKDIEECLTKIAKAAVTNQTFLLQQEKQRIQEIRLLRLQLLRSFTGTVSQVRLKRVNLTRDCYATSMRHLLEVLGEVSVVKMFYLRATHQAIENHLQIIKSEMR
ncbi:hypothetical protein ACOMHN_007238 [Nucella lapillus]